MREKAERDIIEEKKENALTISVIIPCYNVDSEMLKTCVNSVSAQSFKDFEVIIVDDGSEEAYKNAILEVEQKDNRIRILEQNNQGVSSARNNGVANANGKFIIFVDADDVLLPDFFYEILQAQRETDADFVIGGSMLLSKYHKGDVLPSGEIKLLTYDEKEDFKQYMLHLFYFDNKNGYIGRGPVSRLIERDLALETPFPTELSIGEDIVWNLELLSKNIKVCIVNKVWYLYRQHGKSAVRRYNEYVLEELQCELESVLPWIDLNNDAHYVAYCDRIMENIRRVYLNYFKQNDCPLTKEDKRKAFSQIYDQTPWTEVGEKRFRKITGVTAIKKLQSWFYAHKSYLFLLNVGNMLKKNEN